MSHPKDDMVLSPDPKGKGGRARQTKDRQERRRLRMERRRELARLRDSVKQRLRKAAAVVAVKSGVSRSTSGLKTLVRGALVGTAVAALIRLVSGRSYEAQQALVERLLFGEQIQRARGSARARAEVASDPLGATFGMGGGNQPLYEALRKIRTDEELARQAIITDVEGWGRFDVQGAADVVTTKVWRAVGGEELGKAFREWAALMRERQVFPDHPMRYDR